MEPTHSLHSDFLHVFGRLSTFFIRMQLMDLPFHASFKDTSCPRSLYFNAEREELLKFWLVYSV